MRKRKLYLSEFINRCTDRYLTKVQLIRGSLHLTYESIEHLAQDGKDLCEEYEINEWTYTKSIGYIIILK